MLCLGPLTAWRRVVRHDLADDQPVEQHADRGQLLLDRGRAVRPALLLDPGGDVQRLRSVPARPRRAARTSGETARPPGHRRPGVRVADVGGEELEEAVLCPLAGGGDEGGDDSHRAAG